MPIRNYILQDILQCSRVDLTDLKKAVRENMLLEIYDGQALLGQQLAVFDMDQEHRASMWRRVADQHPRIGAMLRGEGWGANPPHDLDERLRALKAMIVTSINVAPREDIRSGTIICRKRHRPSEPVETPGSDGGEDLAPSEQRIRSWANDFRVESAENDPLHQDWRAKQSRVAREFAPQERELLFKAHTSTGAVHPEDPALHPKVTSSPLSSTRSYPDELVRMGEIFTEAPSSPAQLRRGSAGDPARIVENTNPRQGGKSLYQSSITGPASRNNMFEQQTGDTPFMGGLSVGRGGQDDDGASFRGSPSPLRAANREHEPKHKYDLDPRDNSIIWPSDDTSGSDWEQELDAWTPRSTIHNPERPQLQLGEDLYELVKTAVDRRLAEVDIEGMVTRRIVAMMPRIEERSLTELKRCVIRALEDTIPWGAPTSP